MLDRLERITEHREWLERVLKALQAKEQAEREPLVDRVLAPR